MMKVKFPQISDRWKGAVERYKYVLVVIGVGLLFLSLPTGGGTPSVEVGNGEEIFNVTAFEQHIADHLSLIQGAGATRVVLTLKNDGTRMYAQDVVFDVNGKNTATTVTVGSGTSEAALPVQQGYPEFQGALVICPGGDLPQVQLALVSALSALTGLGSDRISVCKGE